MLSFDVIKDDDDRLSRFDTISACDGRTDGRMDVQPIAITCFSIADARKNKNNLINC